MRSISSIFPNIVLFFALVFLSQMAASGEPGEDDFVPPTASVLFKSHIRIDRNYVVRETVEIGRAHV